MTDDSCTVTVELRRTGDDRIEGVVTPTGVAGGLAFSGWLEFLSLLEATLPRRTPDMSSVSGINTAT